MVKGGGKLLKTVIKITLLIFLGVGVCGFSEKKILMEGFQKIIQASEKLDYFCYQTPFSEKNVETYLERATDGKQVVEWETPPVPTEFTGKQVTFVVACGFGTNIGIVSHQMYVNGKKIIEFNTPERKDTVWKNKEISIFFDFAISDKYNDSFGVMYITLPPTLISYGKPVRFKVIGTKENSNSWFAIHNLRNNIEFIKKNFAGRKMGASEEEPHLVFSKYPSSGLYIKMSTGAKFKLANVSGPGVSPRFSPDGTKILFNYIWRDKNEVWIMDLQKKKKTKICNGYQAEWAPNGKKIVFVRKGKILERDLISGKERIISPKKWSLCSFPSYLPDGRIIFVLNKEKIFIIDPEKKSPPELLAEGEIGSTPKCSPDGKNIAYQNKGHIYILNLEKRRICQLTTAGGIQSYPIWSKDGNSLTYCQSSSVEGPFDIYYVEIKSPQTVHLIKRKVDISPDWRGKHYFSFSSQPVMGSHISVWKKKVSFGKEKWELFPVCKKGRYLIKDGVKVENDWYIFSVSSKLNKITLIPKSGKELLKEIEIIPLDKRGRLLRKIKSVYILENNCDNVVFEISYYSFKRDIKRTLLTLFRTRPIVAIKSLEKINKIYIKINTPLVLIPDRFADDLIFDAKNYHLSEIFLPSTHVLITSPFEKGMLMVNSSSPMEVKLHIKRKDIFQGIEIQVEKRNIFISVLHGNNLWHKIKSKPEKKKTEVVWESPFPALWRLVLSGDRGYYSRTFNENEPIKFKEIFPEIAILYLYSRSYHTPLDILTPKDILQDSLGIEASQKILNIKKLYPEIKQKENLQNISRNLRLLTGIIENGNKTVVTSVINYLTSDVLNLLKDMDNRVKEYKDFLKKLNQLCEIYGKKNREAKKFVNSIQNKLSELQKRCANFPLKKVEDVEIIARRMKKFKNKETFEAFNNITRSSLREYQKIIREYRMFVKKLRDDAGMYVGGDQQIREMTEKIRNITQEILKEKYYLKEGIS